MTRSNLGSVFVECGLAPLVVLESLDEGGEGDGKVRIGSKPGLSRGREER